MDNAEKKVLPLRPYRLLEFSKNEATARHYWPDLIDRAQKFITTYMSDTDPVWLFNALNTSFLAPAENWLVLADVDDEKERLVGHMLAEFTTWGRLGYVILIHQLEHDVNADEIIQRGWRRVHSWACEKNVRYVLNYARTQAVARLYRQKYGFEDRRVLQTMDLLKGKE